MKGESEVLYTAKLEINDNCTSLFRNHGIYVCFEANKARVLIDSIQVLRRFIGIMWS